MVSSDALDLLFGGSSTSSGSSKVAKAKKEPKEKVVKAPREKNPVASTGEKKVSSTKKTTKKASTKEDSFDDLVKKMPTETFPKKSMDSAFVWGSARLEQAEKKIVEMIQKYGVKLIAIGNGTASRESEQFVAKVIAKHKLDCAFLVVSEAGASVYSASALANKEYPDLDVTVRGAISIAHRIQDPLAELIKIDPKSIWVGQYQHDVDQKMLKEMLEKKIEDTVNRVWVDVNTASVPLLTYISGLNAKAAQAIVDWRDEHWPFADRKAIKKVKWVGPKAYEQAIGFLRVKNSKEPLDATGIHPESYEIIYSILEKEFQIWKKNLVLPYDLGLDSRKIAELAWKYGIWEDTLTDSINELARPGLDPRKEFDTQLFRNDVLDIKDLQVGMKLTGVVRNITDFWAFVDIWLHNDGLVHKSQMANYYVENPMDVVAVWKTVEVIVLSVDYDKEKVSLTMRTDSENNQKSPAPQRSQEKFQVSRSESTQKTQSSDEKLGDSGMRGNIVFR